jgi:23S rRNA pseudouridine1911/1915/1917 synthase
MAAISEEIKIVYEDEEMWVLNKPARIVVTNENRNNKMETVEDWVKKRYPNNLARGGIVHRLDKGTSGLLVVAKNQKALDFLKRQFRTRQVEKHYWAVAGGDLPIDGQINMPINRSRYSFGKFKVDEGGKAAVTEFKLIKKIKIEDKIYSLIEINLKTGRTHQIRVHMSFLGWPLLGDKTYGGSLAGLGLDRPFLHAYELTIKRPKDEKLMIFKAELADDLQEILRKYEE